LLKIAPTPAEAVLEKHDLPVQEDRPLKGISSTLEMSSLDERVGDTSQRLK
jgi:hypothetical protein